MNQSYVGYQGSYVSSDGGCGGGDGGDGGDGGEAGGEDGCSDTTKDSVPRRPPAKEKLCPKPGASHRAPFQPSPYVSRMSRVHVAPIVTAKAELEV